MAQSSRFLKKSGKFFRHRLGKFPDEVEQRLMYEERVRRRKEKTAFEKEAVKKLKQETKDGVNLSTLN
jgi:hypothetical protein